MRKFFALTIVLVLALTAPAMAALKVLPEELSLELEGIAKEYLAEKLDVSADSLTVSEAWVRELWNIEKEIYCVVIDVNDEKMGVYVDVAEKTVLTEEDFEALVAEDTANEPEEPVFRTMSIEVDAEGEVVATDGAKKSTMPYVVGAVVLAGLGAGAFMLKSRTN
jgi:hypothetical protein